MSVSKSLDGLDGADKVSRTVRTTRLKDCGSSLSSSSSSSAASSASLSSSFAQSKTSENASNASNVVVAQSLEHQFKWFEAIFYWQKACETNEDSTGCAEWRMGNRYWWAFGVSENEEKAKELWQKSAAKGHKGGGARCYLLGLSSFLKDEQKAFQWYRELVNETNDVDGQCTVGWCYENGKGVDKDEKRAAKWYHRAAEKGHANAYGCLGWCFESGIGVSKDEKNAVECYRRAAQQGHSRAQCNLAACYEAGIGVDKDEKQAIQWYKCAAEQGDQQAKSNLAVLSQSVSNRVGVSQQILKDAGDHLKDSMILEESDQSSNRHA